MENQSQKKQIRLRIASIDIGSFTVNEKPDDFDRSEVNFDINSENSLDITTNVITIIVNVSTYLITRPKSELAKIRIVYKFDIHDLQNIVTIEDDKIGLPTSVIDILHSIAVSTTRGAMLVELKGTYLEKLYLPVIDPTLLRQAESATER